jgi:hypothetical protein
MKVLLDENLPHNLRLELVGHEMFTVAFMGWSGIGNGALLREAEASGFEVLITNDRGMEYEQDSTSLPIAVIVIRPNANTIESIRPLIPAMQSALAQIQPRGFMKVPATS